MGFGFYVRLKSCLGPRSPGCSPGGEAGGGCVVSPGPGNKEAGGGGQGRPLKHPPPALPGARPHPAGTWDPCGDTGVGPGLRATQLGGHPGHPHPGSCREEQGAECKRQGCSGGLRCPPCRIYHRVSGEGEGKQGSVWGKELCGAGLVGSKEHLVLCSQSCPVTLPTPHWDLKLDSGAEGGTRDLALNP